MQRPQILPFLGSYLKMFSNEMHDISVRILGGQKQKLTLVNLSRKGTYYKVIM